MNIMIGEIFFLILAIALFVIMLMRMMRKNGVVYLASLVLQAIGIVIHFMSLIFKIKLNLFFILLTYLISVILPIFIIVCEYNKINLTEKLYMLLAKVYLLKKDTKNAKKVLISLIEKNDECKNAHKMLAEIYEKEGGLRKAIDEYVKVVDLDSNAYDSYFKIAMLLKELGNNEDSLGMLTKLVNKKPDYLEATLALSDMLCSEERYKEAISLMNEALRYHPNNFDIYYNMGMIYTMLNDFSSAKTCYEKAAIINTLEYNTSYNIAMIELILGELEEAEVYFTKCIDDEELSPFAYYQLAKIYMIKGDKDTAVKALNIAIDLDNNIYIKAMEEEIFIPIKGYINYPNIDEEDIEPKQEKASEKEKKVRKHLEETYHLVGKLNYKEIGVRYNNSTKDKIEERQIGQ